ncbi:TetR family transcriptional regulator [Kibdelosporangium aridum]|uniref:TetR family transcriptional regulator n=2 Tax=Kibdelosporangium aridum TaxID=2030 RepID=A0A428ZHM4_KIBAR|nr:TetR family transcriptional regulator [Kibdelosporangium aridum]
MMAEEAGLDAITMRGLARRLNVDTMSLYHHIDNRETLLNQITELVLASMELPPATGVFRDDVHAMAQAFRRVVLQYPRCAPLVLTRQLGSFAALAPIEAVLSILRDAGFPPDRAVHAMRSMLAFVIGTLLREVSASPTFSGENLGGVERRLAELTASQLPHVVESAPHLAICDHEEEFHFGLDLLITAVELQLQRQ